MDKPPRLSCRTISLESIRQNCDCACSLMCSQPDLHYPVDDLLLEVRSDEDTDFASNAFNERRKHKRVQAVARLEPSAVYLAVHRLDFSVYFRRLTREEFMILTELRDGKTLNRAIDAAFRKSSIAVAERPSQVQKLFHTWAALGWFCRLGQHPGEAQGQLNKVEAS